MKEWAWLKIRVLKWEIGYEMKQKNKWNTWGKFKKEKEKVSEGSNNY